MITIDNLRLHLPPGYEHRAVSIVQKLGEFLARESVSKDLSLASISLPPLQLNGYYSDEELAQKIARQISESYQRGES